MTPLVSAGQLAGLRNLAYKGLQTPVGIYPRTVGANDYGDSAETWTTLADSVLGWLYQKNDPAIERGLGAATTTGIFRLELPVGTTVNPGDQVEIGGVRYTVENTNAEDTLQIFLECFVRVTGGGL